jgi:hypothetical protein
VDQERLRPARPDVSDDPAHGVPQPLLWKRKARPSRPPTAEAGSTELSSNEVGDASTETR